MTRTLVIDTATAACSVALIKDGVVIACGHDLVGRGHAEQLVPMIARLPEGGRADHILVDCGPGSFT
ncbi:MAG TPA: tRNA (adenosine(37)-N6)-threonylcarbamoyltransferase complex dimerization subunit type 1 TsaB, partial [Sphingomonas sp.]